MIESSQLQVLMALTKAESLSQAAENLGITQSAVSQNIKTLESKVGFSVITRQGKKMVLTPGGRKLAKLSKNYSKRFEDMISEIQQEKNKIIGGITVGTMFGIGKSWVATRLIDFAGHFSELNIKVQMDYPDKLIREFENRDIDCLILPSDITPAHSESEILHNEMSTLVFPKELNIDSETGLKDIMEHPLIFFEEKDHLFYTWCKQRFGQVPRGASPRLVVNAFGQILQAVNEGLGIAVVPTHVLRRSYFKDKVGQLGKEHYVQSSVFNFIYHPEDKNSLKIDTLYDFLLKEVDNLNL
tara:strand:+ start:403 stop:1299 length:897 start_codon:yes stop_codon:yes gene_type:complete